LFESDNSLLSDAIKGGRRGHDRIVPV
jgi:hypothetical protein